MTRPFITLRTTASSTEHIKVRPGSVKREFLDNTLNAHGYHCQPLTTANLHGWEFLLPHDVTVIWDGVYSTDSHHVSILEGDTLPNGERIVDTATANSTISFNLNASIETDEDHYCILMGPPNHFVQGAKPMTALVRTDWYHHNNLQYCWIITTPNVPVTFKKDTPFMYLINYPKNLIETTDFTIRTATAAEKEQMAQYNLDRQAFYSKNPGLKFPNLYKKGLDGTGESSKKHIDSIYKPHPTEPKYE